MGDESGATEVKKNELEEKRKKGKKNDRWKHSREGEEE
jgi:hypothetical protein